MLKNAAEPAKFRDPEVTADGSERAQVELVRLETLWFNTGTLCNIKCRHCYMDSSPATDRLAYLTAADVARYLDEVAVLALGT
jgi:MoaA/NifB/PqqE/SkfB family radical SAM enzyme